VSVDELRCGRAELNAVLSERVKDMPFAEEVCKAALGDAEEGFMSKPVVPTRWHVENCTLSRRLPVRESKVTEEGTFAERTRTVDHETESGVNYSAEAADKMCHEAADHFVWLLDQCWSRENRARGSRI